MVLFNSIVTIQVACAASELNPGRTIPGFSSDAAQATIQAS